MTNKAVVRRKNDRIFYSENGFAFVNEISNDNLLAHFSHASNMGEANVKSNILLGDEIKPTRVNNSYGLIPYSVNVYGNNKPITLPEHRFAIIRDISNIDSTVKGAKKMYVARTQPTNIFYNTSTAIVYDDSNYQSQVQLGGKTAIINSKAEVILPESSSYENMSITVQKNCFIEIKLPENTIDVLKLPEFLTHTPGFIKGTFTKSGEYKIIATHPDGEQIIDIIVPYYERLL